VPHTATETEIPSTVLKRIGRYRIVSVLGEGSFGRVYLTDDEELHRAVAIKVPHPHLLSLHDNATVFREEARILATLDHPHIVPVFDVGRTDDGLCYVVSKYIEGKDLARRIKQGLPSFVQSAELVAAVADALHHAHTKGLVHRDVKPGNILIDRAGRPYLADFGMALRDQDFGKGVGFAGTPVYMSPEQARCEGHRVDGRSDIFSLGVVLYELLTGARPFRGETRAELLESIISTEAKPPRQIDDSIPRELERICLKALAKQPMQRYSTAADMAEDLRRYAARRTIMVSVSGAGCAVVVTLSLLMAVSFLWWPKYQHPAHRRIAIEPDDLLALRALPASLVGHMAPSTGAGLYAAAVDVLAYDAQTQALQAVANLGGEVRRSAGEAGVSVVVVNLTTCPVSNADLKHLAPLGFLPRLESLDLSGTQITDEGLEDLVGLKQLHYLGLRETRVTEAGVERLRKALPNCLIEH
jgi:hypothetical protein